MNRGQTEGVMQMMMLVIVLTVGISVAGSVADVMGEAPSADDEPPGDAFEVTEQHRSAAQGAIATVIGMVLSWVGGRALHALGRAWIEPRLEMVP